MTLDPEHLKARAREATRLDDFGSEPMDDGLRVYCAALRDEAGLNQAGLDAVEASIVATLSERLRVEACLRANPGILDQELLPQIFVVGLPRTGSTALSQFLSEDPDARSIRRWEINALTPPPDVTVLEDPRLAATRAAFRKRDEAMPELKTMLPVEAEDPSEHGPLLGLTFRNLQLPTLYTVPTYTAWLLASDMTPAYAYLAKVLKLLQWKTPGRHWNLKNPPDLFALSAIHAVFPDATLVWTHRDPAKAIPSVASLASTQRLTGVDSLDKVSFMQEMLQFQFAGVERGLADREAIGEEAFVDSTQADLAKDTIGVIRALYGKIGFPFTPEYQAHLEARMHNRPRGQHGAHRYDQAEFGVTDDQIRAPFAAYLSRFSMGDAPKLAVAS